jgi:hypothetical protein
MMISRLGTAVLAAALVVIVTGPPPARAQMIKSACEKTQLDDSFVKTELPAGAQVEVLLAAGMTAPADRKAQYAEMARAIFTCANTGASIALVPITDAGYGRGPAFNGVAPGPRPGFTNHLLIEKQKKKFVEDAGAAIDNVLQTTEQYDASDPLGTLYAASNALHRGSGTKRVIVMIANGWPQTKAFNLFRYGDHPGDHATDAVNMLRQYNGALPDLAGVDVFVAGISKGDRGIRINELQLASLCLFWRRVIHASGGTMQADWCGRTLPGMVETMPQRPL